VARGGDETKIGQKSKADVTQGQYASFLSTGSYLPRDLPETTGVEIRAAIQNGRAVGVTVITTPPNAVMNSKIDAAVRQIQFTPTSEKIDFTTTKFAPV
jgi:eukaryotic-like serine/threonine-protein kinase